jgi:hypothetical protein
MPEAGIEDVSITGSWLASRWRLLLGAAAAAFIIGGVIVGITFGLYKKLSSLCVSSDASENRGKKTGRLDGIRHSPSKIAMYGSLCLILIFQLWVLNADQKLEAEQDTSHTDTSHTEESAEEPEVLLKDPVKVAIHKDYSRNPCDATRNFVDETDSK